MIVTTVVLTNAAQAKCFHSQCRSRMYAVTHQILNLNCILSLEPNGDQWNFGKQHQQGPQNSYPISARGLEGFNSQERFGLHQQTDESKLLRLSMPAKTEFSTMLSSRPRASARARKLPPSQLPTLLDPQTLIVKLSCQWGMRKTIQETLQTPTSEN